MTTFLKLGRALALFAFASCSSSHGDGDKGAGEAAPEGPMCFAREVSAELQTSSPRSIDMMFAVSNTASMAEEQTALAEQFPRLIEILSTGDFNDDGVMDFPPVQSLRLAVVSADLGVSGVDGIEGCAGLGDDGLLRNTGNATNADCSASYDPPFLTYTAEAENAASVASDLACIAALGTDGCRIQQPLESMLKAVWPGADMTVTFVTDPSGFGMLGQAGPGFPNGEIFRHDSLIALVVVTDGEDCSSRRMDHFVPVASPNGIDTRCYYEGLRGADSNLFQIDRYTQLFKMLRASNDEDRVFFAAIAGVPTALTDPEFLEAYDLSARGEAERYADAVLAAPEMQERIDDRQTPELLDDDGIVPSCDRGDSALAYPPRRLVQVARGFGDNGVIGSICQDDLTAPIRDLIARMTRQLGVPCLPRPIPRGSEGKIACEVLWELPRNATCDDLPFLTDLGYVGRSGGPLCKVDQLRVDGEHADDGDGWYYDDFTDTARESCVGAAKQRIAFTETAEPPAGVVVRLSCFSDSYYVELGDERQLAPIQQPELGSPCDRVFINNMELEGDEACQRYLANGDVDHSLFCHDDTKSCVLGCESDEDCPEHWHCDDTPETENAAGGAMCSPGVCSAGPGSASAELVGDPCFTHFVPENGFEDATAYVEGNQAHCGGGACLVYHLDGDPREDCQQRSRCLPGQGGCPDDVLRCAAADEVEERVYCTCRCDAPEGFAECDCPDGFTCVDVLDNAPPEIAGSYCVRNGIVATR